MPDGDETKEQVIPELWTLIPEFVPFRFRAHFVVHNLELGVPVPRDIIEEVAVQIGL